MSSSFASNWGLSGLFKEIYADQLDLFYNPIRYVKDGDTTKVQYQSISFANTNSVDIFVWEE